MARVPVSMRGGSISTQSQDVASLRRWGGVKRIPYPKSPFCDARWHRGPSSTAARHAKPPLHQGSPSTLPSAWYVRSAASNNHPTRPAPFFG